MDGSIDYLVLLLVLHTPSSHLIERVWSISILIHQGKSLSLMPRVERVASAIRLLRTHKWATIEVLKCIFSSF